MKIMKKAIFLSIFIFSCITFALSQDKPVKFTVSVSTDSILMDNYFEVKFILENADGKNFEAPDFSQHFNIISGPNFSTSMSIVNGDISKKMTITYFVEPKETGLFYILPASVTSNDKVLETSPLEVLVVPNPDGVKQTLPHGDNNNYQFNFGNPFDMEFSMPDIKELHERSQPLPEETQPVEKPKKKRKTIRI
ncbi:MAG: hypothetical protein GC192_10520 [Bacteroidetes bacterium]|nr:hypothetical protein [Bacteroidota bacterium]